MRWRIELLGGHRVQRGPRLLAPLCNRKSAALLAYLAVHPGPHGRESLAEMLWPDSDPRAARNRLRVALSSLRQSLGDDELLFTDRSSLALNGAICETDVVDFQAALERARTCQAGHRIAHWIAAFDLYRGRLLPDFFESWIPAAEAELEANYVGAVRALMAALRQNGQEQRALEYGRHALSLLPLREELCGDLMELHAQLGHPANALRLYQELELQLRAQLQSAPSPALVALHERIRTAKVRATSDGWGAIPAIAATDWHDDVAALSPAPMLPPQGTRFFGRADSIETLRQALTGETARLVTLTGRGGIGKTRLAQELARGLQPFWPGRIWFVPLHELGESNRIVARIHSSVLGLPPQPRDDVALESLGQALATEAGLLVLDNFEQLLPWGTPVVQWLVARAPHLRVLVTSRAPLQIVGERVFDVPTLRAPAAFELASDALLEYESVQLFADRARAAAPHFRLTKHNARAVAELCARLEGWPLALELAGAQARALPPHQMLQRLQKRLDFLQSDAPLASYQHASLRAALEWSYELLAPAARQFFARLSVFRGGFDLEAAAAVTDESAAAHLLAQLVSASLVVAEDGRFYLLETLREFAREQLSGSEFGELQRRHAHYFLQLANVHQNAFIGSQDEPRMSSLARSRPNYDNLRAALNWSLENEPDTALELVVAMSSHWGDGFSEAGLLAELAIENAPDAPPKLISAVLGVAAHSAEYRGDHRRHRALAQRRLELVLTLDDTSETAWAYFHLGCAAALPGDYAGAEVYFKQSLRLFQSRQDGSAIERQNLAWTLDRLGACALARGDLAAATRYFRRSLAAFVSNGDRDGQASELCQWADVLTHQGKLGEACEHFARAEQLERDLGDTRPHPWRRFQRGFWHWKQGEYAQARHYFSLALRGFDATGETCGLLNSLLVMGCLLVRENNCTTSIVLLSCEAEQRQAHELPLPSAWIEARHQAESAARAALDNPTFEVARARGRKLSLPTAVALALEAAEAEKQEEP